LRRLSYSFTSPYLIWFSIVLDITINFFMILIFSNSFFMILIIYIRLRLFTMIFSTISTHPIMVIIVAFIDSILSLNSLSSHYFILIIAISSRKWINGDSWKDFFFSISSSWILVKSSTKSTSLLKKVCLFTRSNNLYPLV
jgi:hypothetical protein